MYMDIFLSGTLRGIQYFFGRIGPPSGLLRCLTHPAPKLFTSLSLIKALGDEITAQSHNFPPPLV